MHDDTLAIASARDGEVSLVMFLVAFGHITSDSKESFSRRIVRRYCCHNGEHRSASHREN